MSISSNCTTMYGNRPTYITRIIVDTTGVWLRKWRCVINRPYGYHMIDQISHSVSPKSFRTSECDILPVSTSLSGVSKMPLKHPVATAITISLGTSSDTILPAIIPPANVETNACVRPELKSPSPRMCTCTRAYYDPVVRWYKLRLYLDRTSR
jgi:hypothetical protein